LENLKRFCQVIVNIYSNTYLRSPNKDDLAKILSVSEEQGFPGMIGSLDCMHWVWKNCPFADQGQYSGKEKEPTIVLEAVATHNLWIWHTFFGLPGTLNDITVLNRSPIFQQLQDGRGPSVQYTVNGNKYNLAYYLTNGIYPKYSTLIQSISQPQGTKINTLPKCKKHIAKMLKERLECYNLGMLYSSKLLVAFGKNRIWHLS
jgi:hypothetical protein